jgi:uncharacterized protein YidB (DUF937 family)
MRGTLHQGLHCKHGSPEQGRWLSANLNRQFFRTAVVAPCREMDMGLLDQVFGGTQAGSRGGASPITLGLLALLAYRTYEGKGRLAEMLGRQPSPAGAADSPTTPGHPGLPGGATGGLGALIRNGLGGLMAGGVSGGLLGGGLGELVKQFQQNGHGDVANSWVSNGTNKPISPSQLEQALSPEIVQELSLHTGQQPQDVLAELSKSLPDVVNKLTPDGRLPTESEAARWA